MVLFKDLPLSRKIKRFQKTLREKDCVPAEMNTILSFDDLMGRTSWWKGRIFCMGRDDLGLAQTLM